MSSDRPPESPDRLSFDDAGASRSRWIALALVVALVGWMGSGLVLPGPGPDAEPDAQGVEVRPVAVAVRDSTAEPVELVFRAEGQALPERDTWIRAEAGGDVERVLVEVGEVLAAGEEVARLDLAERQAALRRAEEELRRARRDYENAQRLQDRGSATVDQVTETRAELASAEAQLAEAEQAIEATVMRAPFAGRLEELGIEEGEYVAAGTEIARVVDLSPLTVVVQVPQSALGGIETGQAAEVAFITGETREGRVTFLGTSADSETRTFRAEIEVPNETGEIPAGISAEVRVPTGEVVAHFVSPAILSLGADGTLGVKTVDAEERVAFHVVEIVRAQTDGIWIRGLPDAARIITVGQGYVTEGERVAPRAEDDAASVPPAAAEAANSVEAGE